MGEEREGLKLSLVVPCYNEEDNIFPFFEACQKAFKKIESYEIIFVNDGSRDRTWKQLNVLYERCEGIKLIHLSRNFGKEAAMYAGLQKATGEYITIIDADLQQRPEVVVDMVQFLDENVDYDCVAAYQSERKEGRFLSFLKKMFYKFINAVCEIDFKSGASDFRTFRYNMVQSILDIKEYFRFSKGIFSWVGYNTYYMPYTAEERNAGKTSWSFIKLMRYAIEGIVAFTVFPLKIGAYIGSFFSFAAMLYLIVVVVQKIWFGISIPGYPTLVVMILLIGGIQMLLLGIIGQYIAKIYIEGKKRPIYIVKEYIGEEHVQDLE